MKPFVMFVVGLASGIAIMAASARSSFTEDLTALTERAVHENPAAGISLAVLQAAIDANKENDVAELLLQFALVQTARPSL